VNGINKITHSDILEPINLGSSELVSINQLVSIAEEIAGIKLQRHYKLDAPKGVAGRNSDNTKIQEYLGWEPDTRLRDGMEKTYRWIEGEFTAKYNAKTAHKSSISTFTKGSHPIPGDGFNAESKCMDTWTQGIPAGYGADIGVRGNGSKTTGKPAKKKTKPGAKRGGVKKKGRVRAAGRR
jgi:hypothetical protein